MSQSLQDQLKALGLAKKEAPGKSRKKSQPRKMPGQASRKHKQNHSTAGASSGVARSESDLSLEQAYRLREKETRASAAAAKEKKQLEDRKRRQLNQQIKALVGPNRLNDPTAELPRHFMYKGRIRKVNLSADQLKALNDGVLGLVYLSGSYHLLTADFVGQVRELSEDHVPDLSGGPEQEEEFPVPDDLIW